MKRFLILYVPVIAFSLIACLGCNGTFPPDGGISGTDPEQSNLTATGGAGSDKQNKEVKVTTAVSQEGDVINSSSDVRNQEDVQATTSGHIQTFGFAGIGNAADAIKNSPIMKILLRESELLMAAEVIDFVRLDVVKGQMVEESKRQLASAATQAGSFDGLKTIIGIFTMENQTGFTKERLTDAAAASKAEAFIAALSAISEAVKESEAAPDDE